MRTSVERFLKRLSGWALEIRRWRRDVVKRCGGVKQRLEKRWRNGVAETARRVWLAFRTDDARAASSTLVPVGETAFLTLKPGESERRSTTSKTASDELTFDDVWTFRSPRLVVWNGSCEKVRSWLDVYELTLRRLLAARGAENFWRDVAKAGLSAHFAPEPRAAWRARRKLPTAFILKDGAFRNFCAPT